MATRVLRAVKALIGAGARWVLRKEPVLSGGVLAGLALAAAAWFGFAPSSQVQQIVQTVCGLAAPIVASLLARAAAWSPSGHEQDVLAKRFPTS